MATELGRQLKERRSNLALAGVPQDMRQRWLGHSSGAINDRYTHDAAAWQTAVERLA